MAGAADPACTGNVMICTGQAALDAATSAVANSAADSATAGLGQQINALLVSWIGSLGTAWTQLRTPDLATFGGAGDVAAGDAPPGADQLATIVGWVAWGALVAAILAVIILGAIVAASRRQGEGGAFANRYATWMLGVVMISGATSIVAFLLPDQPAAGTGTVAAITNSTWWLVGGVGVITTILAGAKVAYEQRAQAGIVQLQSLAVLIVVSLAGVGLVGALSSLADDFSTWVLRTSMTCDPAGGGDCFASNMARVLPNLLDPNQTVLGGLGLVLLGGVALATTGTQVFLMVVRLGMLVVLAGLLPLAAAGASTQTGRDFFRRSLVWLGAWLLYKPAAALIYMVAFRLAGTEVTSVDDGLIPVVTGLALMIVAIVALPVMLRFAVPAVSAVAGGSGGGGAGLAAAVALPTGAISLGRAAMGASGGTSGAGSAGGAGAAGPGGPTGSDGTPGAPAPRTSSEGRSRSGSNPFAAPGSGGAGAAPGAGAGGGAAAGSGAAAGGGAGAAGAGAGAAGGASAGASAGAVGGPVGMAAGAALGQAASAATGAVRGVTDGARDAAQSSSEPTGPSGSGSAGASSPPPTSRWNVGPGSGSSRTSSTEPDQGEMPDGSR